MANKSEPFLGTTDRASALAGFESIELVVSQDPYGQYVADELRRTHRYTKASLPRNERCVNPRCQQGGIDLQQIVEFWPDGEKEFPCNGHEGTPAGRKIGNSCTNTFKINLKTVRTA